MRFDQQWRPCECRGWLRGIGGHEWPRRRRGLERWNLWQRWLRRKRGDFWGAWRWCWRRRRACWAWWPWWLRSVSRRCVCPVCDPLAGHCTRRERGEGRRHRFDRRTGVGCHPELPTCGLRLRLLGPWLAAGRELQHRAQRTRLPEKDAADRGKESNELRLLWLLPVQHDSRCFARARRQPDQRLLLGSQERPEQLRQLWQDLRGGRQLRGGQVHARVRAVRHVGWWLLELQRLLSEARKELRRGVRLLRHAIP